MCGAGWPVGCFETYFAAWFVAMDCLLLIRVGQRFFFFFFSHFHQCSLETDPHLLCTYQTYAPHIQIHAQILLRQQDTINLSRLTCKNSGRNANTCVTQSPSFKVRRLYRIGDLSKLWLESNCITIYCEMSSLLCTTHAPFSLWQGRRVFQRVF